MFDGLTVSARSRAKSSSRFFNGEYTAAPKVPNIPLLVYKKLRLTWLKNKEISRETSLFIISNVPVFI